MFSGRIAGVGLTNLVVISLFTMMLIVISKVVFTKHPVSGITEVVNTI